MILPQSILILYHTPFFLLCQHLQHFSNQLPISLSRINHPGARQPILHALRGAAKYGGPFSGAGIVPKNNGKSKDRSYERNNNSNSASFVPKNWMDSDNTFSSFASLSSNDGGEYDADGNSNSNSPGNRGSGGGSDGESNSYSSYPRGIPRPVGSKKGHNRVRQEKRDRRAAENLANGIVNPKKSHHAKSNNNNDYQNDNNQFDRDSDDISTHLNNPSSSSSSSLKNLMYRAHNGGGCDNRTDSIDMRNNKGKLDERSYLHSSSYENLALFGNHDYEKNDDGESSESGSTGSGQGVRKNDNSENNEKRNNNSTNSSRNQGNGQDLDEVASLLNHIRK